MQIVIDIAEETYKSIKHGMRFKDDVETIMEQIENGTPLPKGHGRLIDASQIPYECEGDCYPEDRMCHECDMYCVTLRDVMQVKSIVEADKEGANE